MTDNGENVWKDCNCMNCRLARIETSLKKISHMMNEGTRDFKNIPEKASM
jgi:hypothetical protein